MLPPCPHLRGSYEQDQLREGCAIPERFRRGSAGVVAYHDAIYLANGATDGHQRAYGARAYKGLTRFAPATCAISPRPSPCSCPAARLPESEICPCYCL